jgi:2-polyprenyl-3-methyl-5-hydroxy-6-metoxy-1,4-benzoquinol methylase
MPSKERVPYRKFGDFGKGRVNAPDSESGSERTADYYDEKFSSDVSFTQHYTESRYYGLWAIILDRLRRARNPRVLEIGCGTGQLAHLLHDMRFLDSYVGIDFSSVAIKQAQIRNPNWKFLCADIFEDRTLEDGDYNVVVSTEFLEHVEEDLAVVRRIRPSTMVIASVPNFPHPEHVRHFPNSQEVYGRYIPYFEELYVFPLPAHQSGLFHFLFQGYRNNEV